MSELTSGILPPGPATNGKVSPVALDRGAQAPTAPAQAEVSSRQRSACKLAARCPALTSRMLLPVEQRRAAADAALHGPRPALSGRCDARS
eukprot:3941930-Rhodomonas_salina.28